MICSYIKDEQNDKLHVVIMHTHCLTIQLELTKLSFCCLSVRDGFSVSKYAKQPPCTEKQKQKKDVKTEEDDTKSPVGCNVTEEPSLQDSISHEAVVEPRPSR